jgi:hypothetical protein
MSALGMATKHTAPQSRSRKASRKPRSPQTLALSGYNHFGRINGDPGFAPMSRPTTRRRCPCHRCISRRTSRPLRFTRSTGSSRTAEEFLQALKPRWMELAKPSARARWPSSLAGRFAISARYRAALGGATTTIGHFDPASNKPTVRLSKLIPCMRTKAFDVRRRNDSPAARTTMVRLGQAAENDLPSGLAFLCISDGEMIFSTGKLTAR